MCFRSKYVFKTKYPFKSKYHHHAIIAESGHDKAHESKEKSNNLPLV